MKCLLLDEFRHSSEEDGIACCARGGGRSWGGGSDQREEQSQISPKALGGLVPAPIPTVQRAAIHS